MSTARHLVRYLLYGDPPMNLPKKAYILPDEKGTEKGCSLLMICTIPKGGVNHVIITHSRSL